MADTFDQPHDVSDAQVAFGGGGDIWSLIPKYESIPEEFRRNRDAARPWIKFQQDWFFDGFPKRGLLRREGVDSEKAFRHLSLIQSSFAPKHEHKEAAVAWLASRWFDGIGVEP